MDSIQTRNILEACLLVAGRPMSINQLAALFEDDIDKPAKSDLRESLVGLQAEYVNRGIELVEVASGWRLQSRNTMEHWVSRLFEEKSPRYSRALLETLVLIAYRQPVTRGEIEEVRGVAVSSNIIRTLQERQWVREVGHKDVPGKPALLGTTREFLDYFNLKQLEDLPPLGAVMDLEQVEAVLAAEIGLVEGASNSVAANDESGERAEGAGNADGSDAQDGEEASGNLDATKTDAKHSPDTSGNGQVVVAPESDGHVTVNAEISEESGPTDEPGVHAEEHSGGEVVQLRPMDETAAPLAEGDVGQQTDESTPIVEDDDGVSQQGLSEPASEPESDVIAASDADGVVNTDAVAMVEADAEAGAEVEAGVDVEAEAGAEVEAGADVEADAASDTGSSDASVEIELSSDHFQARAIVPGSQSEQSTDIEAGDTEAIDEIEVDAARTDATAEPDETAEPESDARLRLRQVIDNFASEHQQEIDARDEFESRTLTSRPTPDSDDDNGSGPAANLTSEELSSAEDVENTSAEPVVQDEFSNEPEVALAGEESRSETEASGRRGAMSAIASRPTFLRIVRSQPKSEFSESTAEVQQDVEAQRDTDASTAEQANAEPLIDIDAQPDAKAAPPELIEIPTAVVRESEPVVPESVELELVEPELGDSDTLSGEVETTVSLIPEHSVVEESSDQQILEASWNETPPDPDN